MCIICVEIQIGRATFNEALRSFEEMRNLIPADHIPEVQKLMKELNVREHDPTAAPIDPDPFHPARDRDS